MSIEIDRNSFTNAPNATHLQHMPCEIDHNGDANVDQYFETSIRKKEQFLSSSFRGRPLIGCKVEVPENYSVVVLKEFSKPLNEEEERSFRVVHTADSYTHWNLDSEPSRNDKYLQAKQWMDLAQVLHAPVESSDSQSSTVSR